MNIVLEKYENIQNVLITSVLFGCSYLKMYTLCLKKSLDVGPAVETTRTGLKLYEGAAQGGIFSIKREGIKMGP